MEPQPLKVPALTALQFDALRNAIYHSSRRQFLDRLNRTFNFFVIAFGSAAVGDVGRAWEISPLWFTAVSALAGILQLVFDYGGLARTHEFLQRRFYDLSSEIAETTDVDEAKCRKWQSALFKLYGEEPAIMWAADAVAWNAALDSLGGNAKERLKICWWHSLFKNLLPFNGTEFKPKASPIVAVATVK
jgi:hypothetical protein